MSNRFAGDNIASYLDSSRPNFGKMTQAADGMRTDELTKMNDITSEAAAFGIRGQGEEQAAEIEYEAAGKAAAAQGNAQAMSSLGSAASSLISGFGGFGSGGGGVGEGYNYSGFSNSRNAGFGGFS